MADDIVWLNHAGQSLGLVPSRGGGVAAWRTRSADGGWTDLWRPWDGSDDMYAMASFAMVPWSNRIAGGGFSHGEAFHAMAPNRAGEPYPIHGDGWLQPWTCTQPAVDTLEMSLRSECFGGSPYAYDAVQRFQLGDGVLRQQLRVTHTGREPLPYGLGLHPWFLKTPLAWARAQVDGVWLSGDDPIPTGYSTHMPSDWNLNDGIGAQGSFIDNAYGGWDGRASIAWPEWQLRLDVGAQRVVRDQRRTLAHCLVYRAPERSAFCFEPITHPIDALRQEDRPGIEVLSTGETLAMEVEWRFSPWHGGGPAEA